MTDLSPRDYYRGVGACSERAGCGGPMPEPRCLTDRPAEGWPSEQGRVAATTEGGTTTTVFEKVWLWGEERYPVYVIDAEPQPDDGTHPALLTHAEIERVRAAETEFQAVQALLQSRIDVGTASMDVRQEDS